MQKMKKGKLFLLAIVLLPSYVLAWSNPGDDFSGQLTIGGKVTNNKNPWLWKVGKATGEINVKVKKQPRNSQIFIPVRLPALTVLLGKTTQSTPVGRDGLAPLVTYGKGVEGFSINWISSGVASVAAPVTCDSIKCEGKLTFQIQSAAVLREFKGNNPSYSGIYDDMQSNGYPSQMQMMSEKLIPGFLKTVFAGEGPSWIQDIKVTGYTGLSRFNDSSVRLIEGIYGAKIIPDSGRLYLKDVQDVRWRVSIPVYIEYR